MKITNEALLSANAALGQMLELDVPMKYGFKLVRAENYIDALCAPAQTVFKALSTKHRGDPAIRDGEPLIIDGKQMYAVNDPDAYRESLDELMLIEVDVDIPDTLLFSEEELVEAFAKCDPQPKPILLKQISLLMK